MFISKLFIATTVTKINSHKYTIKSCKTNLKEAKAYNAEIRIYNCDKQRTWYVMVGLRIKRQVIMWHKVHYLWIIQYLYLVLNNFNDLIFLISLQILFQTLTP